MLECTHYDGSFSTDTNRQRNVISQDRNPLVQEELSSQVQIVCKNKNLKLHHSRDVYHTEKTHH